MAGVASGVLVFLGGVTCQLAMMAHYHVWCGGLQGAGLSMFLHVREAYSRCVADLVLHTSSHLCDTWFKSVVFLMGCGELFNSILK
jgi:hypothetical protein